MVVVIMERELGAATSWPIKAGNGPIVLSRLATFILMAIVT